MLDSYSGLFTSESVSEGHPDKIADQISDAVLDEIIKQDKKARVACGVVIKKDTVIVFGEITTTADIDIDKIAREVIKDIGYTDLELGFDYKSCKVLTDLITKQSPDIAHSVDKGNVHNQGAGDQGMMFGYAIDETPELMPSALVFSNKLLKKLAEVRKNKEIDWLRPDGKSQVTVEYEGGRLKRIDNIVLSTQHSPDISITNLRKTLLEAVIMQALPRDLIDDKTKFFVNPSGRFVIGGPAADSGITGKKIIVDTYGGYGRHGGGAFSGKDPSKVDRSGAYMARYIAKNIVAAGLAQVFEIQISYAIGKSTPTSIAIDSFGTSKHSNQKLLNIIKDNFDLHPGNLIENLNLLTPIYRKTATYGHFGRSGVPWEKIDKRI